MVSEEDQAPTSSFRERIAGLRPVWKGLGAYLLYNDGIGTVIRMATIYGTEIGLPQGSLIAAILLVQFIGIPCAFLFAAAAGRVGTKPAILVGLTVYTAVAVLGYYTRTAAHFFALSHPRIRTGRETMRRLIVKSY